MLRKVFYLSRIDKTAMHELIYRLHMEKYLAGELILKEGDDTT